MARLPNGCSRMLCALLQFGSVVSAVNSPSPAIDRTRRSGPRTALSKRFSSLSSWTRSWPETTTSGAPIMSSQKIGPNSLARRARFCTGAVESSDSMLPTTGFVGGCGIGLSLFVEAIGIPPAVSLDRCCRCEDHLQRSNPLFCFQMLDCFVSRPMTMLRVSSPKPSFTPFGQLGADLIRLFLLRPMAAVANQVFFEIGNDFLHAVRRGWRQHMIVLGHDHQRRHANGMVDICRALPVARHVAIPVDPA